MAGLFVLLVLGAVAEMATLGAIVPFLALLSDPAMLNQYPFFNQILALLGLSSDQVLLVAALLFGVIAILAGGIRMLLMWYSLRFSFGLGADIGGEVYRRALYQPYEWHVSRNSSEILAGIDKVNSVVYNVINPVTQGIVSLVITIGLLSMLIAIDAQTAIVAGVAFSLLYSLTTLLFRPILIRNSKIISENVTQRVKAVQEGLGGIRDVLLDGTQPIYHRRFAVFDYAMRRAQSTVALLGASPRFVIESLGMVLLVLLAFWLAGKESGLTGAIPVLGAIAIGAQKLLPQMQLVYYSWASISGNRSQLADVLELLERDIPTEYLDNRQNAIISIQKSQIQHGVPLISLHDVSFRYKPDAPDVLSSINLDVEKGSRLGIVGKTGSGKSTFIDLIMGLLQPTVGQIRIDGTPLNAANRRAWQRRIAHVPQMIFLSDTSIAENIAFGVPKEHVDMNRVREASEKAQLALYIDSLPLQYDTKVGERGVRLSGGQRQRIGLARALYKKAEVLVLDEATSALDDTTENSVMEVIQALGSEITVVMIAHRISTLRECDHIIEIDSSNIRRVGN